MQVTPEIRYFAVARLARQIEKMADDFDIHKLNDPELEEMTKEIENIAHKMLSHCIKKIDGPE